VDDREWPLAVNVCSYWRDIRQPNGKIQFISHGPAAAPQFNDGIANRKGIDCHDVARFGCVNGVRDRSIR